MRTSLRLAAFLLSGLAPALHAQTITVSFPASASAKPLDGRVLFLLSNDPSAEPRMQIDDTPKTQMIFGVTVDGLKPGQPVTIDNTAAGYPVRSLKDVPARRLHRPGCPQHLRDLSSRRRQNRQARSRPWRRPALEPRSRQPLQHAQQNAHRPRRAAHRRHTRPGHRPHPASARHKIRPPSPHSEPTLLTKFWGRPMFLSAIILLPEGFDEHPNAHYPEMVFEGHYPDDVPDFRTTPPDPDLKPDYSDRFHLAGYNRIQQQEAYDEYKKWISPGFPRVLVIQIQHANPFYDDSYAVNSANVGPYGDAIETELMPAIEKQFRGIGQGWARFLYGGINRRMGVARRSDVLSRPLQRSLRRLPRSGRLPRLHDRRPLQPGQHVLHSGRQQADRAAGHAQLSGSHAHLRSRQRGLRSSARRPRPLRRPVRHLAGRLLARSAPTAIRSPSSTRRPASSTTRPPPTGTITTTSTQSCSATGTRSAPSSRASSISTSVPTTLTSSTTRST